MNDITISKTKETRARIAIFDLDGTLLDTGEGIRKSVKYAEKKMGLQSLSDDDLNKFIGPAPKDSYMKYHLLSQEMAGLAVRYHREYAQMQGIFESQIYEGIENLLGWLKSKSIALAVATLKREDLANRILEYFNLGKYFDEVCGVDIQENLSKEDLIRLVLQKTRFTAEQAIMIGDTEHDYAAALACNVVFIGVTYGYGFNSMSELAYKAANSKQLTACLDTIIGTNTLHSGYSRQE